MRAPLLVLGLLVAGPAAATDWPTYAGGPYRLFFNPAKTVITAANVAGLRVKWSFPTGAIVTASPAVVTLDLPAGGHTPVAFIASWDNNLYALRVRDGTPLWHFPLGTSSPQGRSAAGVRRSGSAGGNRLAARRGRSLETSGWAGVAMLRTWSP